MYADRSRYLARALVGALTLSVLVAPLLVTGTADAKAKASDPKTRVVSAPNVFYPLSNSKAVKDLKTHSKKQSGTDIKAPCNSAVRASTPGTAQVFGNPAWGKSLMVRVITSTGGIMTQYGFLSRSLVTNGQIIQAGQQLGNLTTKPKTKTCSLYYSVYYGARAVDPSVWLNYYVGKAAPIGNLFNSPGFTIGSFNMLGASHTAKGGRYATYPSRLVKAVSLMNARSLDVVGTQEFQEVQYDYFISKGYGNTFGAYYWDPDGPTGKRRDTENAILWRKSTMEFISGETYDIPYFHGNTRHVSVVLLREKATGRTAYFLNVHNPANVEGPAAPYRARAIAIEKAKIVALRATGRPVFITGDFNDHQAAFCPMTADKLTISPNSIPSMTCVYPKPSSIDWIFAAGQARFSSFARDTYSQSAKISDHPMVYAQAHLQN